MEPIDFKEKTGVAGKDQPEYLPLPIWQDKDDPRCRVISCWGMSFWERVKVLFTGRVWLSLYTFGAPIQPQSLQVDFPFVKNPIRNHKKPEKPVKKPGKFVKDWRYAAVTIGVVIIGVVSAYLVFSGRA